MIRGYCRCSTNEDKQDINRQIRELKALGVERENIFLEYESGTKKDRVEFNRLLNESEEGDTIITTEVSRLSRSTQHLCEVIDIIKNKHLKLVIGNTMTIDCTKGELDPMTNAFLQMSGVFAELERNMISARVKSGMANAKAKGKVIGRPKVTSQDIPGIFYKHYPLYKDGKIKIAEFSRLCNMSRTTIYKYLKILKDLD
ncbi:recombinase family protein [Clostridium perfringens]|uniref:recombinase family protein n=1 Tax=Clostridium perfringens TaxID=1502 RepID=UPI0034E05D4C